MDTVINFSNEFVTVTQNHNLIATAKHFSGHGLLKEIPIKNLFLLMEK